MIKNYGPKNQLPGKVGLLSGALTIVSVISGPNIFCSVLWNFQAVSWEQGADRSIKVTTLSKQICIKNKINLSSVNWKFKRTSGTSLTSLNGSNLKSALFNWNYCWNKSKQFKNCFIYCPKLNKRILKLLRSQKMWFVSPMVWTTLHHILFGLMRLLVGLILNLWMGQLE